MAGGRSFTESSGHFWPVRSRAPQSSPLNSCTELASMIPWRMCGWDSWGARAMSAEANSSGWKRQSFMMEGSWLLMKVIGAAAARSKRMLARLEAHADHPGADGGYSVDDGAFDERLKWAAQSLKKILVEHAGDVVGDHKYHPADHSGGEHRHRAVEEAGDRNQHADEKQRTERGVAFERIALGAGDAIGDKERYHHDHDQSSAHINAGLQRGAMSGRQDFPADLQWIRN